MATAPLWSKTLVRKDLGTPKVEDRKPQTRAGGVLSQIEDATEAILRKHQKKTP
jgi:hypothetical protein